MPPYILLFNVIKEIAEYLKRENAHIAAINAYALIAKMIGSFKEKMHYSPVQSHNLQILEKYLKTIANLKKANNISHLKYL